MKIAIISPHSGNLQDMGRRLESQAHSVVLVAGGKTKMRSVAEQHQPDLMLVEGMCCDPSELAQVEYVTSHHPGTVVILLCAMNTPEFLIQAMQAGVREVLPSPADAQALDAAVARVASKLNGRQLRQAGSLFAFLSCKGGAGATFLATNLAWQLAQSRSVLLIDLNLQFGDALSFVYDGVPATTIADLARDIHRMDASFLAAAAVRVTQNFSLLAASEDPAQALEVKPEHVEAILNLAVRQYDFVLLDLPRSLDPLTICALDRASRIFTVLQTGLPHIRHAVKCLNAFRSLNYPPERIELIVNRYERGSEIGLEHIRRAVGDVRLHTVPNSWREVSACINHGNPLVEEARSNAVSRQLADMAQVLNPRQEESRSLLGRIFRRA